MLWLAVLQGLAITQGDGAKVSPIHIAASKGHKVALDFLLDGLPHDNVRSALDAADALGRTAVHFAAISGSKDVVETVVHTSGVKLDPADSNVRACLRACMPVCLHACLRCPACMLFLL